MIIDFDIVKYLNEQTCDIIINKLTSDNLLGKGFWGAVYRFDIKKHNVSIKIQPIENDKKYDITITDQRNIQLEINLLKQLSDFKIKHSFLHFPYFYTDKICDNQLLIFYEYYPHNLSHFFIKPYTLQQFKSIIYQIIVSIYFFQQITGYFHDDIHIENFLLNTTSTSELSYHFPNLNISKKIKLFDGKFISLWDYAGAIKIDYKADMNHNPDILLLKNICNVFITKILFELFNYIELYSFCKKRQNKSFKKYHSKILNDIRLKWKHISNLHNRNYKIEKTMSKALLFWIIENNYLDLLLTKVKISEHFPTYEMLDWLKTIPENINDAIQFIE